MINKTYITSILKVIIEYRLTIYPIIVALIIAISFFVDEHYKIAGKSIEFDPAQVHTELTIFEDNIAKELLTFNEQEVFKKYLIPGEQNIHLGDLFNDKNNIAETKLYFDLLFLSAERLTARLKEMDKYVFYRYKVIGQAAKEIQKIVILDYGVASILQDDELTNVRKYQDEMQIGQDRLNEYVDALKSTITKWKTVKYLWDKIPLEEDDQVIIIEGLVDIFSDLNSKKSLVNINKTPREKSVDILNRFRLVLEASNKVVSAHSRLSSELEREKSFYKMLFVIIGLFLAVLTEITKVMIDRAKNRVAISYSFNIKNW